MDGALASALLWTQRLTGLAVLLQTLELASLRRAFADDGVWRWSILRDEHRALALPLRQLFAVLLPYRAFLAVLLARAALACLLGAGVGEVAWLLALSQLLIGARFRGTFNGGSDYMTMVLLLGLSLASLPWGALPARAGLGYICAQLTLSYVIAGGVKLRQPAWRSGQALAVVLRSERYAVPGWVAALARKPKAARCVSWLVMLFELAMPWAISSPRAALVAISLGLVFHAANALALGLNRFLFAWAAAYPALWYFARALGVEP